MRSQIIDQSIKVFWFSVFFSFTVANAQQPPSQSTWQPTDPNGILFSSFLLSWDVLQQIAWKQWIIQFPMELNKWGQREDPSGSSLLLNSNGIPKLDMKVVSDLNADHSERVVELVFRNMRGSSLFGLSFKSYGTDLKTYDVNLIRQGVLPFGYSDPGETYTDMKMYIMDSFAFRIRSIRETVGKNHWLRVKLLSSDDFPYLTYSERSSPSQRYFRYEIDGNSTRINGQGLYSIMVVKTVIPGAVQGSEEYFLDDRSTDAKTFRDAFDVAITSWVVNGWQKGMASLLTLLQHPDLDFDNFQTSH